MPTCLFLLAEREHEGGLPWVHADLLRPAFWTGAPLTPASVAGALLVVAALWSLVTLTLTGPASLLRGLRARSPWLGLFVLAGTCAVAGQVAEEIGGGPLLAFLEEGLELAFACLLIASLLSVNGTPTGDRTCQP